MPHVPGFHCNVAPGIECQSFAIREQETPSAVPVLFLREKKAGQNRVGSRVSSKQLSTYEQVACFHKLRLQGNR